MSQGFTKGVPIDTDVTLSANSNLLVPSQFAVRTYVTNQLATNAVIPTRTIATTAPLTGGGDLSANRTLSITKSDISTDGYLSSTDWNTFNNKVNSSIQITAISPLTGGGDLSSNIIIGIPAVSSFTDGYITASDYVDFKNSIKQLGSQTIGYFTKYTGDKAIAQSSVYEDGTTLYSFRNLWTNPPVCHLEIFKKRKVRILILFLMLTFLGSSCSTRRGSFRRVKGHKVWIPGKGPKLRGRYERCYNFSN